MARKEKIVPVKNSKVIQDVSAAGIRNLYDDNS